MDEMVDWLAGAVDNAYQQGMRNAALAPDDVLELAGAHRRLVHLYRASAARDAVMREVTGGAPLRLATGAYRECLLTIAPLYRAEPGYDPTWRPYDAADIRPPDAGPNRQEPDA